jgi:hypothetical protein
LWSSFGVGEGLRLHRCRLRRHIIGSWRPSWIRIPQMSFGCFVFPCFGSRFLHGDCRPSNETINQSSRIFLIRFLACLPEQEMAKTGVPQCFEGRIFLVFIICRLAHQLFGSNLGFKLELEQKAKSECLTDIGTLRNCEGYPTSMSLAIRLHFGMAQRF